jgi:hypothetical protein
MEAASKAKRIEGDRQDDVSSPIAALAPPGASLLRWR